jgi:Mg-chelatase subunit ChlD
MQITFGRTAYVAGTPNDLLDKMADSPLSISLMGESTVVVTRESIEEFIRSYDNDMAEYQCASYRSLKEYLSKSLEDIDKANDGTPIGDIFFTN